MEYARFPRCHVVNRASCVTETSMLGWWRRLYAVLVRRLAAGSRGRRLAIPLEDAAWTSALSTSPRKPYGLPMDAICMAYIGPPWGSVAQRSDHGSERTPACTAVPKHPLSQGSPGLGVQS